MIVFTKNNLPMRAINIIRKYCSSAIREDLSISNFKFPTDDFTNVSPKILSLVGKNLHNKDFHPLCLMKKRIMQYFYVAYRGRTGKPIFSVFDDLHPMVTVEQNFDSLLIPKDHVSRKKSDCFYFNKDYMLRAHMTAHQVELIKMGLDNFLMFGDVYRRDEIDSTHYPVFHQCDAVRLFHKEQLFDLIQTDVFERNPLNENKSKQKEHTVVACREIEQQLKATLEGLARCIFGNDIECRWVDAYFPFTNPSWELEIKRDGNWLEVLGCGIIRHSILQQAGAGNSIGWAFGLGLDRLAMIKYSIPDIRAFWMEDPGFLIQFHNKSPQDKVTYKEVSVFPPCKNDISFWINDNFEENDFHSLVREVGGDLIEQVKLIDKFTHPKTGRKSRCYTIVYRHLEKTLTQAEVNKIHKKIEETAVRDLGVIVR